MVPSISLVIKKITILKRAFQIAFAAAYILVTAMCQNVPNETSSVIFLFKIIQKLLFVLIYF